MLKRKPSFILLNGTPQPSIKTQILKSITHFPKRCLNVTRQIPLKLCKIFPKSSPRRAASRLDLRGASLSYFHSIHAPPVSQSYYSQDDELQQLVNSYRQKLFLLSPQDLFSEFTYSYYEFTSKPNTSILDLISYSDDHLKLYTPFMIEQLVLFAQGRCTINPQLVINFTMPIPKDPLPTRDTIISIKRHLANIQNLTRF